MKLAEYKDGKFEGFLELGDNYDQFVYVEKFIAIGIGSRCIDDHLHFKKDEKDPLNRFNGLFDGRTYGDGRFVLIEKGYIGSVTCELDEILNVGGILFLVRAPRMKVGCLPKEAIAEDNHKGRVGNLHENPELWEKVK